MMQGVRDFPRTIAIVEVTMSLETGLPASRRHRIRPDRIELPDADLSVPDEAFRRYELAGVRYRTAKRYDYEGLPFLMIGGLKYRPVQRGRQWKASRIKVLGQAPKRRRLFFFQAEDGIRDDLVTGVQTCALPI